MFLLQKRETIFLSPAVQFSSSFYGTKESNLTLVASLIKSLVMSEQSLEAEAHCFKILLTLSLHGRGDDVSQSDVSTHSVSNIRVPKLNSINIP